MIDFKRGSTWFGLVAAALSVVVFACVLNIVVETGANAGTKHHKVKPGAAGQLRSDTYTAASPPAVVLPASPPPPFDEAPWKAVERIDAKLANMLLGMTIFVGFITGLIAIYEFFKLKEIERIRSDLQAKNAADLRAMFADQYDEDYRRFEAKISSKLLQKIDQRNSESTQEQLRILTVGSRVMFAFVSSELSGDETKALTSSDLQKFLEWERALVQARSDDDNEVLAGLSYFCSKVQELKSMTATLLMHYLIVLKKAGSISSWDNQELCVTLTSSLSKKTKVPVNYEGFS